MDQTHALTSRYFLPLFLSQFLAAANDNFFKSAAVVMLTYHSGTGQGAMLVTLASGAFIFPFFLFSALGGQLADGMDKAVLIRRLKLVEIPLVGLSGLALIAGHPSGLIAVLFALGVQAALFGPAKYGILRDHLAERDLIAANGWIEGATFLAILLGTIGGGLLVMAGGGTVLVTISAMALATVAWAAARFIPAAPGRALTIRVEPFGATAALIKQAAGNRREFRLILAVSWFWLVGSIYLSQLPVLTSTYLRGNEQVVTLFLTLFSIGIAAGSLACRFLVRGQVTTRLAGPALAVLALASADFGLSCLGFAPPGPDLMGAAAFLAAQGTWRFVLDLLVVAAAGGVYVVPLYASLQRDAPEDGRARVIAANNVINAGFMVGGTVAAILLFRLGLTSAELFFVLAFSSGLAALWLHRKLKTNDTV